MSVAEEHGGNGEGCGVGLTRVAASFIWGARMAFTIYHDCLTVTARLFIVGMELWYPNRMLQTLHPDSLVDDIPNIFDSYISNIVDSIQLTV